MCKFTSRIQFLRAPPMRSYSSWGTRHHCPVEVGAYDLQQNSCTWTCTSYARIGICTWSTASGRQHPKQVTDLISDDRPEWKRPRGRPRQTWNDRPAGGRRRAHRGCRLGRGQWSSSLYGATTRRRSSGPVSQWVRIMLFVWDYIVANLSQQHPIQRYHSHASPDEIHTILTCRTACRTTCCPKNPRQIQLVEAGP